MQFPSDVSWSMWWDCRLFEILKFHSIPFCPFWSLVTWWHKCSFLVYCFVCFTSTSFSYSPLALKHILMSRWCWAHKVKACGSPWWVSETWKCCSALELPSHHSHCCRSWAPCAFATLGKSQMNPTRACSRSASLAVQSKPVCSVTTTAPHKETLVSSRGGFLWWFSCISPAFGSSSLRQFRLRYFSLCVVFPLPPPQILELPWEYIPVCTDVAAYRFLPCGRNDLKRYIFTPWVYSSVSVANSFLHSLLPVSALQTRLWISCNIFLVPSLISGFK